MDILGTRYLSAKPLLLHRDALSAREDFYRGYVKGYEEGLNKAWDELIGLTTKGFSSREIQVMAKSKRQSIGESVRDVRTGIRDETGIDLTPRCPAKGPRVEVEAGNTYLIESMHPALIEPLVKITGPNVQIQAGGGVAGHPGGVRGGARAMAQAVDAAYEGIAFSEYAKTHPELREAIVKWG